MIVDRLWLDLPNHSFRLPAGGENRPTITPTSLVNLRITHRKRSHLDLHYSSSDPVNQSLDRPVKYAQRVKAVRTKSVKVGIVHEISCVLVKSIL